MMSVPAAPSSQPLPNAPAPQTPQMPAFSAPVVPQPVVPQPAIPKPAVPKPVMSAKAPSPNLILIAIGILLAFLAGGIIVYLLVKPKG